MKRRNIVALLLLLLAATAPAGAQSVRDRVLDPVEHSAGSSMAYRYEPGPATPVPEGFTPFYISHFGRHGSRYHTAENIYRKFYDLFSAAAAADALTPLGREVKQRIDTIFAVCDGHAGELTPVGVAEHRDIATRMYANYPEVFRPRDGESAVRIFSRSTSVDRVVKSMQAFDAALVACEPRLEIEEASGGTYNSYLNHYTPEYKAYYNEGPWRPVYEFKRDEWVRPERLLASLFSGWFVRERIPDRKSFMTELFAVASILQDAPLDVTLYDLFTDEEIYSLWRLQNLNQYLRKGPSALAGDLAASIAKPLLRDFLACADAAVAGGSLAADFRFGHGEGLMPLAALMQLSGACTAESDPDRIEQVWQDFRITPMAGNIQWIFYRNAKREVLVRVLLNEREVTLPIDSPTAPYYDWRKVRKFYRRIVRE